jgi:hypothetical protein
MTFNIFLEMSTKSKTSIHEFLGKVLKSIHLCKLLIIVSEAQ